MIRFGCRHKEVIDSGQIWISGQQYGRYDQDEQSEVL